MRIIRKVFDREKLFQACSKLILVAFSVLICLWMISGARADSNSLKDIKIKEEAGEIKVEFSFQNEIQQSDIALDFQRNFAQLSINGVQIHPARTKTAKNSQLEKVFAYQYQPDTARARIMFKGELASAQAQSTFTVEKKKLIFILKNQAAVVTQTDQVKTSAAAIDQAEEKMAQEILGRSNSAAPVSIQTGTAKTSVGNSTAKESKAKTVQEDEFLFQNRKKEAQEAISTSATAAAPSAAKKMLTGLVTVLLILGSAALAFRRFVLKRKGAATNADNLIEIVSTQLLSPKRSIAVIRVAKQHLVVAMAGDSITLLTQLGADSGIERFINTDAGGDGFDSILKKNLSGDNAPAGASASDSGAQKASLRDSIRTRMESFKPLPRA